MTPLNSVLIVDDEPSIRHLMVRWAESLGLQPVTAGSADEAVQTLEHESCDIAVVDLMMPGKNGLWLARELRRQHPEMPVILATAYIEDVDRTAAPIVDLLIKPFKRARFIMALDRGREWRRQAAKDVEWHQRLSREMGGRVSVLLRDLGKACAAGAHEADALVRLTNARVADVAQHAERVARYALQIAAEMDVPAHELSDVELAARFHDLGKVTTPEAVLAKPSPLSATEVLIMRAHVETGASILEHTRTLAHLAPIVRASHEWFSGGGYPQQLAGSAIPLASRIIGVADAYDAMTQDRQYRSRLSAAEATSELLRSVPIQFDPDVVAAFLTVLNRH
jgi:putative nucleotidyltransferase with HDIG domain